MLSLYFGSIETIISTVLVVGVIGYSVKTILQRKSISKWGKRVLILALWGLLVCVVVSTRDSYHLSVMAVSDSSVALGVFTLDSMQSILCCIGGGIIALCSLTSLFIRKQGYWKSMFIILSCTIFFKICIIEISRIIL